MSRHCIKPKPNFSKSQIHRVLFASLLSNTNILIKNISMSDDVKSSLNLLSEIGCNIKYGDNQINLDTHNLSYQQEVINLNESGTTMRFAIPIMVYLFGSFNFSGNNKLLNRPLGEYNDIFNIVYNDQFISVNGELSSGEYTLSGEYSSQMISGLLFVLPLLELDSKIFINNMSSIGYIDLTIDVLEKFGIIIHRDENIIKISGNQKYDAPDLFEIEYDESSLAYLRALKLSGIKIEFAENNFSLQPDFVLKQIIDKKPKEIDCNNCPDLIPCLIYVTQFFNHPTILYNVDRLKFKESDRLRAILDVSRKLGINVKYVSNRLYIIPTNEFNSCELSSYKDHRICLMELLFATQTKVKIDNINVIKKSYPEFLEIIPLIVKE